MNVLSLFDGISCGQVALERAGIPYSCYYASEIEPSAIKVTQTNYPNTIQVGDVSDLSPDTLPQINLLIGGSPCQGFSFAGKQLNFDDPRSRLFFEYVRLKNELKPRYWLLENVKMARIHQNKISEILEVEPVFIDSADFCDQSRKRLYWTNIPIDNWNPVQTATNVKYAAIRGRYHDGKIVQCLENRFDGKANALTLSAKDSVISLTDKNIVNGYRQKELWRHLTSEECELLQTLPLGYTSCLPSTQRRKAIGNGWTVDVITHIFKGLKNPQIQPDFA